MMAATQQDARDTARRLIADGAIVLDTETTGIDPDARLVELAILAADGTVLFDRLIHPGVPIPPEATGVHGITDEDVAEAPTLDDLWPSIRDAIAGRQVASYNAAFDHRLLSQHMLAYSLPWIEADWHCLMLLWHDYQGLTRRDRWWRLDAACFKCGVALDGAHRARADAMAALGCLRWIAGLPLL